MLSAECQLRVSHRGCVFHLMHACILPHAQAHELCEEVLVAQRPVAEGSEAADGSTAGTAATAASRNTSMRISLLDIPTEPPAGAHPASFTGLVPGLVASGTLSRQAASSSRPSLSRTQQENGARSMYAGAAGLLFRGPRVKMGADLGQVHAAISPAGRLCYRCGRTCDDQLQTLHMHLNCTSGFAYVPTTLALP